MIVGKIDINGWLDEILELDLLSMRGEGEEFFSGEFNG